MTDRQARTPNSLMVIDKPEAEINPDSSFGPTKIETGHKLAGRLQMAEFGWILSGVLLLIFLIMAAETQALPKFLDTLVALVRLPLGFIFSLFVPGYCLTAALFPRQGDLTGYERLGLSTGLSVAWIPVLALILNSFPFGLHFWPLVLGNIMTVLMFTVLALWRRAHVPAGQSYRLPGWRPRPWWNRQNEVERRLYLSGLVALFCTGIIALWIFLEPSADALLTEFYLLGPDGLAENFPREAKIDEPLALNVGIVNQEGTDNVYRVQVWAVDPWRDRRQLVSQSGEIGLENGGASEIPITWSMPWSGENQVVEISLLVEQPGEDRWIGAEIGNERRIGQEESEAYRQLRLWIDVSEGASD